MQIESILTRFFLENISEGGDKQTIIDNTETNMVALRRTIYLTIQSSLDFEECAHKLMKMELKPGQEVNSRVDIVAFQVKCYVSQVKLGDNCIQNFHLVQYIVGYMVGNFVLRRRISEAVRPVIDYFRS